MAKEERTGDATIGGRMDEDELLAIAAEEGYGDEEAQPQEAQPQPEQSEPPGRQQPSRH